MLVHEQRIAGRGHLHDLFHLVSGSLGHVHDFRVRRIVFGQLFDFSGAVVKLLVEHIPLQVDSELLHHALESDWEVMLVVLLLSAASPEMVSAHARHDLLQNDFVHDSTSLGGQNVFEPLQVFVAADDGFEFLQREFITLEHGFHRVSIKINLVLLEQVHDLPRIERSRSILVELREQKFYNLILVDFLFGH